MNFLYKNEFWMILFSFGLLYWLFNISIIGSLLLIIPFIISILVTK
ncbi:MAG: hypothetical protein CFH19_00458 [Alphaproteobacteria bacterium MarineAlpha5_Bin9]|nr:MAG: hypothetical protein CFH19_00458 [Alphaproteobacteria bacterium MarineAlpha5_Bin9]